MTQTKNFVTAKLRVGIDTGGTFTDFIAIHPRRILSFKIPSTPHNPALAILLGLERILTEINEEDLALELIHGTTVATNALLERKGAKTALVTTAGFEDVIEIGRQARPDLYNLAVTRPAPLVPEKLRFGVKERIAASGEIIQPCAPQELSTLVRKLKHARVESVAISLLFSFANPDHEQKIAEALAPLNIPLTISHQLLPAYREYERTSTVVLNAYLAPKVSNYLTQLEAGLLMQARRSTAKKLAKKQSEIPLRIMQSSGGSISAVTAAAEPVRTILSGPAGGVIAATRIAERAGITDILTFDMGGTSTDVALCKGNPQTTNEAKIIGLPVAVPVLDIHTVGAGGGSIAYVDAGGALRVGPESAGADPGPACYGKGTRPTVTDANVILGRFGAAGLLSGTMPLDYARAENALATLTQELTAVAGQQISVQAAALGIIKIANANMEQALRLVSIERGQDPRRFTLVSFGGAGGLHAVALAEALRIPRVLIPTYPGAFSALGVLLADVVKDYAQTVMLTVAPASLPSSVTTKMSRTFSALQKRAARELRQEGVPVAETKFERILALRYQGQSFELEVSFTGDLLASIQHFHALHQERYGHANPAAQIEIVSLRVRGIGLTQKPELPRARLSKKQVVPKSVANIFFSHVPQQVPIFERADLPAGFTWHAPALIVEYGATTLIPAGWQLQVDRWKNLILMHGESQ